MKYMILTYLDEKAWLSLSADEQKRLMAECEPHIQKLLGTKKLLAGAPLHPTSTATTIRYRDGKQVLTDGPYAETKEVIGGYWIVGASSYDEAVALAHDCPQLEFGGSIEVREVEDLSKLGG